MRVEIREGRADKVLIGGRQRDRNVLKFAKRLGHSRFAFEATILMY